MHIPILGPGEDLALAKSLTKGYETALMARDMKWFQSHTTSDYVNLTPEKWRQPREEALLNMQVGFGLLSAMKRVTMKITSAKREQGGLVVVCKIDILARYKAQGNALIQSKQLEEDLWVPVGKGWSLKRTISYTNDTKIVK